MIRSRGFTIVELLIVIVVIAVLAAISMVAYNGITNRAKTSALASSLSQAAKKAQTYATTNSDVLPADLATIGITNTSDTTYQYTRNTAVTPQLYCITATSNGISSHIASNGVPTEGPCPGHTGTAPTVAANGEPCPTNFIVVPGSSLYGTQAFCVMKYEAKIQGVSDGNQTYSSTYVAESRADGRPWVNITQTNAIAEAAALGAGYHLISEAEWLTIAQNIIHVGSNWSSGSVGSGYVYAGHNDNVPTSANGSANDNQPCFSTVIVGTGSACTDAGAQRRTHTLNNGEVIWDLAGNVWEWTSGTSQTGARKPGDNSLAWREWRTLPTHGSLSPDPFPSYAHPSGGTWDSNHTIGRIYSNALDSVNRGLMRGGSYGNQNSAGVFAVHLDLVPGDSAVNVGFRVARSAQ